MPRLRQLHVFRLDPPLIYISPFSRNNNVRKSVEEQLPGEERREPKHIRLPRHKGKSDN